MTKKYTVSPWKIVVSGLVATVIALKVTEWILANAGLPPFGPDAAFWAIILIKLGVGCLILIPLMLLVGYSLRRRALKHQKHNVVGDNGKDL